jgi:hypothetical protein
MRSAAGIVCCGHLCEVKIFARLLNSPLVCMWCIDVHSRGSTLALPLSWWYGPLLALPRICLTISWSLPPRGASSLGSPWGVACLLMQRYATIGMHRSFVVLVQTRTHCNWWPEKEHLSGFWEEWVEHVQVVSHFHFAVFAAESSNSFVFGRGSCEPIRLEVAKGGFFFSVHRLLAFARSINTLVHEMNEL